MNLSKDEASEADFVEIENLRKRMTALMQRLDRVLIPLRAMREGIMPGEPDYPEVYNAPQNSDFDEEELAINYDESQYEGPKER